MKTFTIREAAEKCGISYQAMRKRADRDTVATVMAGGVRRIPQAELERVGLWPDSATGDKALSEEIKELRSQLQSQRALAERAESAYASERETRERMEAAALEHRAEREAAEQRASSLRADLEAIAAAGPIRALRLRREMREKLGS